MIWTAACTLAHRELVRFFRQRSRVLSALVTPVLFWALVGSGFAASFQPAGAAAGVGALTVGCALMVSEVRLALKQTADEADRVLAISTKTAPVLPTAVPQVVPAVAD